MSESTIRWSAREGLIPTLLAAEPEQVRHWRRQDRLIPVYICS